MTLTNGSFNPQSLKPGHEHYEHYIPHHKRREGKEMCAYDYRAHDGELFSCVKPTLEEARHACARWLTGRGKTE